MESDAVSEERGSPTQPSSVHLSVRLDLPDREPRRFEYDFEQAEITLGRDPANDIQVPLTTVSRRHARIFFERGDYFLEDLGSTHGTIHNDRPIDAGERKLLRSGDKIRVVSFHIVFETSNGVLADRQPGERTEQLARRMVQEVLQSLEGADTERPSIRVMNGNQEGRRFELHEDSPEVVIGRNPECDVCLDDGNISRRHCLVKRSWHGFTVQDLGSRNGVQVNGKTLDGPRMLRDGDEIEVGGIRMAFIDPPSRLLEQMGALDDQVEASGSLPAHDEEPAEYEEEDVAPMEEEAPAFPELGELDGLDSVQPYNPPADDSPPSPELDEEGQKLLENIEAKGAWMEIGILVLGIIGLVSAGVLGFLYFN